jgi:hypothetical protein
MKLSLALGPRKPLSPQMAWGCFTTNLAFPGFGSLLAGRAVGYFQIPFTVVGQGLSIIFGVKAIVWFLANWSRLQQSQDDPFENLLEFWMHLRWSVLGIAIFFFGLLWALITSLSIRAETRAAERTAPRRIPPKL